MIKAMLTVEKSSCFEGKQTPCAAFRLCQEIGLMLGNDLAPRPSTLSFTAEKLFEPFHTSREQQVRDVHH